MLRELSCPYCVIFFKVNTSRAVKVFHIKVNRLLTILIILCAGSPACLVFLKILSLI